MGTSVDTPASVRHLEAAIQRAGSEERRAVMDADDVAKLTCMVLWPRANLGANGWVGLAVNLANLMTGKEYLEGFAEIQRKQAP